MKFKFYLLICIIFLFSADITFSMGRRIQIQDEAWKQLPLRSHSQKNAGLTGGEGMQMIYDIAYAPSNPDTVYLVSDTSQVWKSIDGGNSWQMMHKGFLSNGGIDIAVDPVNEKIVFAAGSLHEVSYSSLADGIYRTKDGGENWILVKAVSFFRGKEGEHFIFDPDSVDNNMTKVIYAGTHKDGLMVSKNYGDTWDVIGFKGERILDMKIDSFDSSALYILTVNGLSKVYVKDYVVSRVEKLAEELHGTFRTFAINPKNSTIIYMAMGKGGVYKSIDAGKTFNMVNKGLSDNLDYAQIALSPVDSDYLYLSVNKWKGLNPIWSHDGGLTWHRPATVDDGGLSLAGEHRWFAGHIEPHPKEFNVALTAANGMARILKTDDGGISWSYSGNGYTGGRKGEGITSQAFYPDSKKMILFLMDFGPVVTIDGGDTFEIMDIPRVYGRKTTRVGAISPVDKNLIITAIGGWKKQKLAVSRNNGSMWEVFPETEDLYQFIAFHPQKSNIIYANGFISKDSGKKWKKLTHRVSGMFRGNGDIIYSVTASGRNKVLIVRSTDQGENWEEPYPYLPIKAKLVREIDIDPLNPDRIYVASLKGLYIFDNNKEKWLQKGEESGLEKDRFGLLSVRNIAVDLRHPEVVYVNKVALRKGHSNGIFRSVDYGMTWKNVTYNLGPEFSAQSISISPYDGRVFIGSSHGTWTLPPPY